MKFSLLQMASLIAIVQAVLTALFSLRNTRDSKSSNRILAAILVIFSLIASSALSLSIIPLKFNPSTMIRFELSEASFVTVKVFDMIGREIETLVSSELPAGLHSCTWNAHGMANGVYFYRLKAGAMTVTNRLLLLK